jgi:hypothetical protein
MAQPVTTAYNSQRTRAALYYARKNRRKRQAAQAAAEDPEVKAERDAISLAYVREQNGVEP